MTEKEFSYEMGRLIEVYGDKAYPEERVKLIFREMRRLTGFEFGEIVSELIASSQYAPMIGKFREASAEIALKRGPELRAHKDAWLMNQPVCNLCNKTGNILAVRKEDRYLFAFRCTCAVGETLFPNQIPWTEKLRELYEPQYIKTSIVSAPPQNKVPNPKSLTKSIPDERDEPFL